MGATSAVAFAMTGAAAPMMALAGRTFFAGTTLRTILLAAGCGRATRATVGATGAGVRGLFACSASTRAAADGLARRGGCSLG